MLSQEERDRIEGLLLRERESVLAALERFAEQDQDMHERAGEMSLYRFHMADLGTEAMEKEKDFLLASNEGRRLYEIDEALRRLYGDPERFGSCERCGRPIGMERLEVVPETRYCIQCKDALEEAATTP